MKPKPYTLPAIDALVELRKTHTLKEIGAMYDIPPSTLGYRLNRAFEQMTLELMSASKRRAWAAWEEKQRRKQ